MIVIGDWGAIGQIRDSEGPMSVGHLQNHSSFFDG